MKIGSLFLLLLLSGCTSLAPDYKRPSLPVPDTWGIIDADKSDQKNQSTHSLSWKAFFQSPQLQNIIEAALSYNRDLKIATLNVQAARALYRIEFSNILPHAVVNVTGSQQNMKNNANLYQANVAASFELDLFGRIQSKNDAALESYFATQAAQRAAQIILIAETVNAYLQWLADRKILDLTESTLRAQKKSYDLIHVNYQNGIASDLDLAQAQTAIETAQANWALYTRRVQQDKNALLILIGHHDDKILSSDFTLDEVKIMEDLPQNLSSTLLLQRPDIEQAEHQLKAANANIGAARAAFFPRISLTGTYGFASASLTGLFSNNTSGIWSFTPQFVLPIFEGSATNANLDLSEIRKEITIAQYEKAIQKAFREVADELAGKKTLDNQLKAQYRLIKASQKAYDLSYTRYQLGLDSFLSSLDAQRSLYQAQKNAIDVQMQRLVNSVNLYKVLGRGAE